METNLPQSSKKQKVVLGVGDAKIGAALMEEMGLSCQHTGVVPEVTRGISSLYQTFAWKTLAEMIMNSIFQTICMDLISFL